MAIPFPILLDLSVSQGSGRAGTTRHSVERHPAFHMGWEWGFSSSHSSASPGLCALSVSGSQAPSHHSVGIEWAAEAEACEKSQCLEQVRKFHFLHRRLARSLDCTDSGGINMLLTNPLIISHVILL